MQLSDAVNAPPNGVKHKVTAAYEGYVALTHRIRNADTVLGVAHRLRELSTRFDRAQELAAANDSIHAAELLVAVVSTLFTDAGLLTAVQDTELGSLMETCVAPTCVW